VCVYICVFFCIGGPRIFIPGRSQTHFVLSHISQHKKIAKVADVANAIMEVVSKRVAVPGNRSALTLRDVNAVLDEIVGYGFS
jgi:hypothetical protein